jgi:electron transport complex protein RnfG
MKQPTVITSLITLAVVLVLFSALLSFANLWTGPRIAAYEANRAEQAAELIQSLFPGATSVEKMGVTVFRDSTADYFRVKKGDTTIGYAVNAFGKGFQSTIHAIAAVAPDFSITTVTLLYEGESEDFGGELHDEKFLAQFKGKRPDRLRVITEDEPADTNAIVALTGATISSRALAEDAVKKAVLFLKKELVR